MKDAQQEQVLRTIAEHDIRFVRLRGVPAVPGYGPGRSYDLVDDWLRVSRRARAVVEQVFYGEAPYRSGGVTHG